MKKLLGIVVLGLLLCSNAFAGWFDKDKIKVTKCWNPSKFNSYKEDEKYSSENGLTRWEWELKLKEKIAIRIMEINGQLKIDKFIIKIITDEFIIVTDNMTDMQFDLKNNAYIALETQLKCKFK